MSANSLDFRIDHLLKNCKSDATLQEMFERSSYNTLKDFAKVLKKLAVGLNRVIPLRICFM